MKRLSEGKAIDWATAEAIAFGSLMYQGISHGFESCEKIYQLDRYIFFKVLMFV
jgi:hypothetical protein